MYKIGETKQGREIGKGKWAKNRKFVLIECPKCKTQCWRRYEDTFKSTYTGYCYRCYRWETARRHFKSTRTTDIGGYVWISITPDDPFFPMAKAKRNSYNAYILEHRLVMAQHLGRCLASTEIVHHLNGIRDDNRRENLAMVNRYNHKHNTLMKQLQKRIRDLEQLHLAL